MADLKKCDRCSTIYTINTPNASTVTMDKKFATGKISEFVSKYDLCPSCTAAIKWHINNMGNKKE